MNESEFKELQELSWRRQLSPAEEARLQSYLALHPKAQSQWESDLALNQLLADLAPAPVPSNFTSLVLQAVDRDQEKREGQPRVRNWKQSFFPRLAWALCLTLLVGIGVLQYQKQTGQKLDRDVALIVDAMPSEPRVLQHFDDIQGLGQGTVVDEELWVALAKSTP